MRRSIALLLALVLLAVVPAAPVAAVSKSCPSGQTEFQGFNYAYQSGFFGYECGTALDGNGDAYFYDSVGGFQNTDNNALNSWVFYNPTFNVWCLKLYDLNTSASLTYALGHSDTWWGPSGGDVGSFNNKTSRVIFWQRTGGSCA